MEVLHPLVDSKDQIVKDSQVISKLRSIEGASELLSDLLRLMVRRRVTAQVSQRVKDRRGGSGIHQRVEKVSQERAWRLGDHCQEIELRVQRNVRGRREEIRLKAGGGEKGGRVGGGILRADEASKESLSSVFPLDAS
jgi:hypothetical protein